MASDTNLTKLPQEAWFILSVGGLFSWLLFPKNRIVAAMFLICNLGIFRSFIFELAPKSAAFESTAILYCAGALYYLTRQLELQENCLKWFLVPACLNMVFVFVQKFFPYIIPLQSKEVCGLLGNAGLTATFLGMTTPIFIRHFLLGIPLLFLAIVFCQGSTGLLAFSTVLMFHVWHFNRKVFQSTLIALITTIPAIWHFNHVDIMTRLSYAVGTLEGIMRHPFLGWGAGSFLSIISQIPPQDSIHFGVPFNTRFIMNHPANEFLFGWWNYGIAFPVLMVLLIVNIFKNYTWRNQVSFGILLASICVATFFMFTPPTLFLLALSLGIYENQKENDYGRQTEWRREFAKEQLQPV